jgi:hypothetical protein
VPRPNERKGGHVYYTVNIVVALHKLHFQDRNTMRRTLSGAKFRACLAEVRAFGERRSSLSGVQKRYLLGIRLDNEI